MSASDVDAKSLLSLPEALVENIDSTNGLQRWSALLQLPISASLEGHIPSRPYLDCFNIGYSRQHGLLGLEPAAVAGPHKLAVAICDGEGWKHLDTVARALRRLVQSVRLAR